MITQYQQAKKALKETAHFVKKYYPKDKPLIRQTINDKVYFLSAEYLLKPYQIDLLSNYACKLHPKD